MILNLIFIHLFSAAFRKLENTAEEETCLNLEQIQLHAHYFSNDANTVITETSVVKGDPCTTNKKKRANGPINAV